MPIFEYVCRACQQTFEHFVLPTTSAPPTTPACPHCHSQDLERLRSAFAVNSAGTRDAHLQQARKRAAPELREKKQAEVEMIKHIEESHDH